MRVELKCLGQEERGWADQNHGLMVRRADRMLLSAFSVDLSTILIPSHGVFSVFLLFFVTVMHFFFLKNDSIVKFQNNLLK